LLSVQTTFIFANYKVSPVSVFAAHALKGLRPPPSRTLALMSVPVRSVLCRRRTMRLHAPSDVWVYWESGHLWDVSHVRNVSFAGLFIETHRSRSKGDLVHVHFLVAEGQIRLDGTVTRAQSANGLGVKFLSVTNEDIPQLTDLINRIRSTSLIAPVLCPLFDFCS
jgi:hypothetical protein